MKAYTTQNLPGRNVYRGKYGNFEIRVVVGYDAASDAHIGHAYVTPQGQHERKLHGASGGEYSLEQDAIDDTFLKAEQHIDSGLY